MKVFVLFYDQDQGCREEWNTFYTPQEVFLEKSHRDDRITFLKSLDLGLEFHEVDLDVKSKSELEVFPKVYEEGE